MENIDSHGSYTVQASICVFCCFRETATVWCE